MWRCIFATLIINKILIFPSVSAESKAVVTVESCRRLTAYIAANDVTYKAGVDVRGRAVKPADLSPTPNLGLKDQISFQLILDIARESRAGKKTLKQFRGHSAFGRGLRGRMDLGRIVIKNGTVTLDGKPLAASQQTKLYQFCLQNKKHH